MSAPATYQQARRQRGELYLLFSLGKDRYALDVHAISAVLPMQRFKAIPDAPKWVSGLFVFRGEPLPVIDLCQLVFATPAQSRASTRLVVVRYLSSQAQPVQLGLILEQATDTQRLREDGFSSNPVQNPTAPYLGMVQQTAGGMVQRISVEQLLTDEVRALLVRDAVDDPTHE
ncbi:chemotaxis protein CheW [Pseudomonas sp. S9]|uniref:chemotaxis protein CheW n=1 Tax=Pseudomonas sp. S9 TaxID=686578 RepID=UPI00025566B0|nr:chemotaxis protein CheW [Pseudomonas sp. S9]